MVRKIIGVSGKARSGKDESTKILAELTGYNTYTLADPIKEIINEIFGWDDRHAYGELKEVLTYVSWPIHKPLVATLRKHLGEYLADHTDSYLYNKFIEIILNNDPWTFIEISPRMAYQRFGTDFARKLINENVWLDLIPDGNVIISDVRFNNESEYIRDNGGTIIHIEREIMPDGVKVNEHESENGIDKKECDFTVINVYSESWCAILRSNLKMIVEEHL